MTKYLVKVGGTVLATYNTREEAEKRLFEVKNSFLALVHPIDCMFIKAVESND